MRERIPNDQLIVGAVYSINARNGHGANSRRSMAVGYRFWQLCRNG